MASGREYLGVKSFEAFILIVDLTKQNGYSFALASPSLTIPSHPTALPASSSALPYPWLLASRPSLAAFMSDTPCALACSPDAFHAWEPVTLPIAACGVDKCQWKEPRQVRKWWFRRTDEGRRWVNRGKWDLFNVTLALPRLLVERITVRPTW